jgi:hypothetical protein
MPAELGPTASIATAEVPAEYGCQFEPSQYRSVFATQELPFHTLTGFHTQELPSYTFIFPLLTLRMMKSTELSLLPPNETAALTVEPAASHDCQ